MVPSPIKAMMDWLWLPEEANVGSIRCHALPSNQITPSTQPLSAVQTLIQAW